MSYAGTNVYANSQYNGCLACGGTPSRNPKFILAVFLLAVFALLPGCMHLPVEGPLAREIVATQEKSNRAGFVIIEASAALTSATLASEYVSPRQRFGIGAKPPLDVIGPGDVLTISVWESDPNGLFSSSPADIASGNSRGSVTGIEVDTRGNIRFPYVGRMRAQGLAPATLSLRLQNALASKTSNPQVHVQRSGFNSRNITVAGIVARPGFHPMMPGRTSLMDAVAQAGGSTNPGHQSLVTVTRGKATGRIYLDQIVGSPLDNINVLPRDLITLEHRPKHFLAFGAVGNRGRIAFQNSRMTVLDAIAIAGGLDDSRANPTGVFVFRFEPKAVVEKLGYSAGPGTTGTMVPVIYRFNLRSANHYFFATRFLLRRDDMIYVSNARAVQVDKFLAIIGRAVGIGTSISRESINAPAN